MGFALPGATSFGEVTAKSVLEAGRALGVPYNTALRILSELLAKLPEALNKEAAALQERHKGAPEAARRFIGVEARVVRVMQKMVIPDMLKRLNPAG